MRRFSAGLSIFALSVALAVPAKADPQYPEEAPTKETPPRDKGKQRSSNQPALVTADQIIYDRDLDTVTASGHVEVDQSGRFLLADAISYNMKQDVIIATGNVAFTDIDGQVNFSDYMELSGDMKEAIAHHLRLLMVDNSRMAATTARRTGGTRNILDNAIYTACEPCANDPDGPPLWDVRAQRIVHDDTTHRVVYTDAWFDVDGYPVAYFPYFSHADSSVKRESGVLPPTVFNNAIIGTGVRTPYYQVISPYQDLLLEPQYTTKEGAGFAGLWRARTSDGQLSTQMSVANEPSVNNITQTSTGWNVDAKSQFSLDDTWRAGYDVERSSDRDYLRYYNYALTAPYLTSRPYIEGFSSRDYFAVEAYSFENQSDTPAATPPGAPNKTPTILPLITYSAQSTQGWQGSYWTFDTHSASIMRVDNETDSRRINSISSWHLPYTTRDGQSFNFTTSLRADVYDSDNIPGYGSQQVYAYRLIPTGSVDWRYPLEKMGDHSTQILTPIVMANVGPYGGNSSKIPNEDSLDFELDDSNVFSPTPFTGYDRVSSGPRLAYGAEYTVSNRGDSAADLLIGESYQPHPEHVFPVGTGLDNNWSDIVGRAQVAPSQDLKMTYHFRIDSGNFSFRHSEVDFSAGSRPISATIGYAFIDTTASTLGYGVRDQIVGSLDVQFTRRWSAEVYDTQNLGPGGGPLQTGARVGYEDECTIVQVDGGELHTTVNTIVAGHYVIMRIVLKTLTEIPVNLH